MRRPHFLHGIAIVGCLVAGAKLIHAATHQQPALVSPLFDLRSLDRSPFPSDRFTVADENQITGRRVNLPMPDDCRAQKSECEDRVILNQLDGFNMQARFSVPFDGEIDPASVTSKTVFLVNLTDRANPVIGINSIVWTPAAHELSFRPDISLDQSTRYALVVTTGVRDASGHAIAVADHYSRYRTELTDADSYYRDQLTTADAIARRVISAAKAGEIAALSVFTTQTFSHVIERIRETIQREPAPKLDFGVGPNGARAVFQAATIQSITNNTDVNVNGPLTPTPLVNALGNMRVVPGAVGTLAFGKFRALDFTARPSGHIAPIPTRTGRMASTGTIDESFNLWLPAGTPPPQGWPVAMCGHGSSGGKNVCFAQGAAVLASHGIAVISLNAMSHGTGPRQTMTVTQSDGTVMTIAAPGSGYDQNGDGTIDLYEPRAAVPPHMVLNTSGPIIQTVALYLQLVRAIRDGVDVDGDGRVDLDANKIYFHGHSIGGLYGMLLFANEPALRAAVFLMPPGTLIYNSALSPPFRSLLAAMLAARVPSLVTADGLKTIDGVATAAPYFDEALPLRDQPPRINTTPVPSRFSASWIMLHGRRRRPATWRWRPSFGARRPAVASAASSFRLRAAIADRRIRLRRR